MTNCYTARQKHKCCQKVTLYSLRISFHRGPGIPVEVEQSQVGFYLVHLTPSRRSSCAFTPTAISSLLSNDTNFSNFSLSYTLNTTLGHKLGNCGEATFKKPNPFCMSQHINGLLYNKFQNNFAKKHRNNTS